VVAIVCPVRSTVAIVGLCEDKDILATTEGVLKGRSRTEIDIRVATGSLVGGGAIKVPDTELTNVGNFLADGLARDVSKEVVGERNEPTVVLERRPPSPSIQTSGGM